jgi:hypothetical protein
LKGSLDLSATRKLIAAVSAREIDEFDSPHIVICSYAGSAHPTFFGPFADATIALRTAGVEAATLREECPEAQASFTIAPLRSPELMELSSTDHGRS